MSNEKEGGFQNGLAGKLVDAKKRIVHFKEELDLAEAEYDKHSEEMIKRMEAKEIRAFNAHGFDFYLSRRDYVNVVDEEKVMLLLKKDYPKALRMAIDKSVLNHYILQENVKVPGTKIEVRTSLNCKTEGK